MRRGRSLGRRPVPADMGLLAVRVPGRILLRGLLGFSALATSAAEIQFLDSSAGWQLGTYLHEPGHGSGVAAADFDGDGRVDLFVPQAAGVPDQLYRNLGDHFVDIAAMVGLASDAASRVALWLDYDADGDLDLWVAGDDPQAPSSFTLYRQDPGPLFIDVTAIAGVFKVPIVESSLHHWAGLCAGDFDRDGDLDLVQTTMEQDDVVMEPGRLRLLENQMTGTDGHHLVVRPRMAGTNRFALGAVVRVHADGAWMTRRIAAGTSYMGQEPMEAFFGLGSATTADQIEVRWPDGTTTSEIDVAADRVVDITILFADSFESGDVAVWSAAEP